MICKEKETMDLEECNQVFVSRVAWQKAEGGSDSIIDSFKI